MGRIARLEAERGDALGLLVLVATCAAVAVASPAFADGPGATVPAPPLSAPPPDADWTGPYLGLSLGAHYGEGEAEREDFTGPLIERDVSLGLFPGSIDGDATAAVGSIGAGYNLERGRLVGGIELDVSALNQDSEAEFSRFDADFDTDTNSMYGTEISGLATLRLRAGFAQDRTLFYGTAGIAAGRVRNEFALGLPTFRDPDTLARIPYSSEWTEDGTRYGYVLGAGVERRLTDRLSLKGEVIYYDLEDITIEARDPDFFPGQGIDYEFQNDGYVARVGINFAF